MDTFEPRRHFSLAAAATVTLTQSAPGPGDATTYTYAVSVKNTGSTSVGTFWFAWLPDEDLLPALPSDVQNPTGWTDTLVGTNDDKDGTSILWKAGTGGTPIAPGDTLAGFTFTTTDSPAVLKGKAPAFPKIDVTTSVAYSKGPFSDAGFTFDAAPPSSGPTTPASTVLSAPKTAKAYTFGAPVKLSASLKSPGSRRVAFAGTATAFDGDDAVGQATVSRSGAVTFSTAGLAPLSAGDHALTLVYSGDASHGQATSSSFTLHVTPAKTKAALAATPAKPAVGQSLSLNVHLSAKNVGTATPSGTVSFKDGDTVLGTAQVDANGTATFTVDSLSSGTHAFSASYAGDADFAPALAALKRIKLK